MVDLRRRILETSLELIDKKGLDALSMREVSRRLNVTHGAPYYHFKNRSSIVAALVEEGLGELTAQLEAAAAAHADPARAFEACGRAYVAFAVEHPASFRLMFRPELTGKANRGAIERASAKSFGVLVAVVARCQTAGVCAELDAQALALTGWSTAHGLASLVVDGPMASKGDPKQLAQTVGATLGALLVRGSAAKPRTRRRQS
ncbi:MAG: TetR/AcrR family transcriptional regulator [Myxococcaceae bacterium]